jgi:uncharacterized protein (TIGR02594 family)
MNPRWLDIARGQLGVHETPGPKATAQIAAYHATTTLRANSDEVPWCSSFVNWCIQEAGLQGTRSAAAASWLSWGAACSPREGCIVVIRQRGKGSDHATGSASGNHVGFLLSQTATHVEILGGNQSDSVKVSRFPIAKYDVIAYRWPAILAACANPVPAQAQPLP